MEENKMDLPEEVSEEFIKKSSDAMDSLQDWVLYQKKDFNPAQVCALLISRAVSIAYAHQRRKGLAESLIKELADHYFKICNESVR